MSVYINELSKLRPQAKTRKSRFWLHTGILLLVGFYLRAWSVLNESPSFEEVMAALVAVVPFGDYIGQAQPDFCPPVVYLFSHMVASFKASLTSLRVISIVAGALTPLALYMVGRRLYGESAAVLAAYLVLFNPLHVYYSQEFQPSATFALLSLLAFLAMVRSAESNQWKDWIVYDILAILLLHTQREAAFFVIALPIIQFCRALFFPPVNQERRIHRFRLIQAILLNYFIVIAISIPWLWIMPNKLPWSLSIPALSDLAHIFGQFYLFGFTGWRPLTPWVMAVVLMLLLFPPLLKTIGRLDFRTFAVIAIMFLALLLPFVYSQFETPRFVPEREGLTALPYFCLTLGILLARCNWVIKIGLFTLFSGVFLFASVAQARTLQKTATTDMLNTIIDDGATTESTLAFFPGYTTALGTFWEKFYDKPFNRVAVSGLLKVWADIPRDRPVYFVISQFPTDSAHLYTIQGALTQYADSTVLWQNRLNMVIKSENVDQRTLAQWYDEPRSLRILDQPTSNTQFIFTAADAVFRPPGDKPAGAIGTEQETTDTRTKKKSRAVDKDWPFAYDRVDLSYDPTGHRFIWTTEPVVSLDLPVTLAPGKYLLRLHCTPDFDQPEYGRYKDRTVQLELRSGEDRRRVPLENAQTVALPFSTDVELMSLPVTISVDQMHEVPSPSPGQYGIKIYSISIDQEGPKGRD